MPYINSSFLQGFSALVLSKGGKPAALYEAAGLDKELFMEENFQTGLQKSLLIPFDKFIFLLEAAASELDFPEVAMALARQQDMMILAPLGPMLKRCNNVLEALDVIVKYLKILVSGFQVSINVKQDFVNISFTLEIPQIQQRLQYQDYAMASAVNVLHGLMGRTYPIRSCSFLRTERDKERIADYSRYYGCPVAFNCPTLSLTVDSSILQQDVEHLLKHINSRVSVALSSYDRGIVNQVSQVISFSLANGNSSIEDIALSMNLSQRTLQRKLSEQNTSFSALLDAVRFNMANQYLTSTYYRLTDIGLLLGYSNLSSFSRGYQRWSGVNPTQVRKRMLHK